MPREDFRGLIGTEFGGRRVVYPSRWSPWRVVFLLLLLLLAWLCSFARGQQVAISREAAKEQLGYELFFDAGVLSLQGTVSCATCHNPDPLKGWSDGLKVAVGARNTSGARLGLVGVRNTPSIIGAGRRKDKLQDRDGRARSLYAQTLQAVTDPLVCGMPSVAAVVERINLRPRYRYLASIAYGTLGITEAQLRECLVAFVSSIDSRDLPADKLYRGEETGLPDSAIRGWQVFQIHCIECHDPENAWQNDKFHNLGISARSRSTDTGRGAVTQDPRDNFKFRTPSLIEFPRTPPYMHDGSLKTIEEVVGYFQFGGRFSVNGQVFRANGIDPSVAKITFTNAEAADLVDFLTLGFQNSPDKYPFRPNPHEARP